jgi:hypothetical protein
LFKHAKKFKVEVNDEGEYEYEGVLPEGGKVGMKCVKWSGKGYSGYKTFGDRLRPLHRYLRGNVGKKWDDVYSDICRHNNVNSLRGHHLREHVDRDIDRAKDWIHQYHWSRYHGYTDSWNPGGAYVDFDGILRYGTYTNYSKRWAEERKAKAAEARKGHIIEVKGTLYWRRPEDKVWFEVAGVATRPEYTVYDTFGFALGRVDSTADLSHALTKRYGRAIFLTWKRSVSRKQIRDLGLEAVLENR